MKKLVLSAMLLAAATALQAQAPTITAANAPATSTSSTKVSPAKKKLVEKILKLQQPSIELLARSAAEAPLSQLGPQANMVLSRLAPEQREPVGKGMQADAEKYIKEVVPLIQQRAIALAPESVGKVLEEKFSEAELKQIVALLESPVYQKFSEQRFVMQRALQEKLATDAETRNAVEPKLKALDQSWAKRIRDATPAATDKATPSAPAAPGPTSK
jgi:hypothetical protein